MTNSLNYGIPVIYIIRPFTTENRLAMCVSALIMIHQNSTNTKRPAKTSGVASGSVNAPIQYSHMHGRSGEMDTIAPNGVPDPVGEPIILLTW